jgi:hypothetical protein
VEDARAILLWMGLYSGRLLWHVPDWAISHDWKGPPSPGGPEIEFQLAQSANVKGTCCSRFPFCLLLLSEVDSYAFISQTAISLFAHALPKVS